MNQILNKGHYRGTFAYTSSPSSEAKADVQAELLVVPNPSDQYSVVQFITPQEGAYTLEVYDINGRLVGDVLQGNGASPLRINTGNFANGLYLCRLIKGDGSPGGFTKVIVQH